MNHTQFSWMRSNRRLRLPGRLTDVPMPRRRRKPGPARSIVDNLLRSAARDLRQRERAADAWQRVAPASWLPHTRVTAVLRRPEGGFTLCIAVDSATLLYEIRRRGSSLQQRLARFLPQLRRLQCTVAESDEP
jgi:hypothetical protein